MALTTKQWAIGVGILITTALAGLAWAFKPTAAQWVEVPEPRDSDAQFFYERSLSTANNLVQKRRVLVNYKERTQRNEASFVYEYEFDCFTERYRAEGAKTYFSANGKGEVIREIPKERLGMAGGFGVQAVQRELCAKAKGNLNSQESYSIGMWDFSMHAFLNCQHHRNKDTKAFLNKIRSSVKPVAKVDGAFRWSAQGQMGGYEINLPVNAISLGVCDASGDSSCGAAGLTALHVSWPVETTKIKLKQYRRNNSDFTVEKRDAESGATLQPVLSVDPKDPKGSILYCDSGRV